MKLPRDLTGRELANYLKKLDYQITHQTGSHIRLTTLQNGEPHITIPTHEPLKMGTLSNILHDIARHFQITKEQLIKAIID